ARYVTLTAKHHDGYALWATETSEYGVAADRDVVRTLAAACGASGVALFLYYSLLDWHEPTYEADFPGYLDFLARQLHELLTAYGPTGGLWFDGAWSRPREDWRLDEIYAQIHALQPEALVGNNPPRHSARRRGLPDLRRGVPRGGPVRREDRAACGYAGGDL